MKWWHGWAPIVVGPVACLVFIPSHWPRWAFMWTLAFALYCGCKWLTWRRTPVPRLPWWRHIAYLLAWPGLDAAAFLDPGSCDRQIPKPSAGEWMFAFLKCSLGLVMFFGLARLIPREYPYLVGWVGMIGFVLVLHFGIFHGLSCAWRRLGVDARPLMNWPIAAVSVSDFWGHRWNTAFRDLTYRFLFRPLVALVGVRGACLVGFLFSGLVHELVISVPAQGGYGGPTVFFAVQGLAMLIGRSAAGRRIGLGSGYLGWLFTMIVMLLSALLLFHRPFVLEVVVPFMNVVRAI